jgi:hypothetical protein
MGAAMGAGAMSDVYLGAACAHPCNIIANKRLKQIPIAFFILITPRFYFSDNINPAE